MCLSLGTHHSLSLRFRQTLHGFLFCAECKERLLYWGMRKKIEGSIPAEPTAYCQGPSLYLPSQPTMALGHCFGSVCFLAQRQPRESSPLWVGGGVSINERLIKAHCCHIPGRLSHLTDNIHHSFTLLPHILMAGRGPCDTGRTL